MRTHDYPTKYYVTYLSAEKQAELIAKHGDLWMDYDPERYFVSRDFVSARTSARTRPARSTAGNGTP